MLQRAGAAAGRRFLLVKQGQQQLGRGLATLPTPKFFDYKACVLVRCVCMGRGAGEA